MTRVDPDDVSLDWNTLPKAKKHYVQLVGVGGALAHLYSRAPRLRERYRDGGWLAAIVDLVVTPKAPTLGIGAGAFVDISAALKGGRVLVSGRKELDLRVVILEGLLFERWGFVPEWCSHKGHWYLRHTVGRPPEACPLHAKAARQARWLKSPTRQAKQSQGQRHRGGRTDGKATRTR